MNLISYTSPQASTSALILSDFLVLLNLTFLIYIYAG